LDAGRKGISDYRKKQIVKTIHQILKKNNFIKYRRYVVGGADSRLTDPFYDAKKELEKRFSDKGVTARDLVVKHLPPLEEQEVVALFIELCAKKMLKGYFVKVLSGYQVYDGLFEYTLHHARGAVYSKDENPLGVHESVFKTNRNPLHKDILVEFKKDLRGLYGDRKRSKKDISHIDILVCWEIGLDASFVSKEYGEVLQRVELISNPFYGVTHQLITGHTQPLYIIELKQVLESLEVCS
jgi:hypothetical protein